MIGGYLYKMEKNEISFRLHKLSEDSLIFLKNFENGYLFYDGCFSNNQSPHHSTENLILLTQDLLIARDSDNNYKHLNLPEEFFDLYIREKTEVLKRIVNNFRAIIVDYSNGELNVYAVSNRAGNGRIYYHQTESGIIFSSDIRFLFRIINFTVNDMALYAILKYGAIPEPLTICEKIQAVPPGKFLQYNVKNSNCDLKTYFHFDFPCETEEFNETKINSYLEPAKIVLKKSAQFLSKQKSAILISGGIDSSLYTMYLKEFSENPIRGIHCTFGDHDPEFPYAKELAQMINAKFLVGNMKEENALEILNDTVNLTGHPFSDFSSMPIVYILKFMKNNSTDLNILIEGNGGDDCFGFPDLNSQNKFRFKNLFPKSLKKSVSRVFKDAKSWKLESQNVLLSKIFALTDVHELNAINYFLVLTPINFLGLNKYENWDSKINLIMEDGFNSYVNMENPLSYKAKVTIRQLMHVNSRRWAAKAFSVGENLGIRVIYPYIWLDVLTEQGKIPWEVKNYQGIVKWPLKRLLEEYMPKDFIYRKKSGFVPPLVQWLTAKQFNNMVRDTLLAESSNIKRLISPIILNNLLNDALEGENLRHSILNFLWGAFFTEKWIKSNKKFRLTI
jgi:asparagine synthase (glutamine-hydrolysing)